MPNPQLMSLLNLGKPQQEQSDGLPVVAHHATDGQTALQLQTDKTHDEPAEHPEHPYDVEAHKYGWLTLASGEMYNGQIIKTADTDSQVFISLMSRGSWEAWRETWKKGNLKSSSNKIIVKGVPFNVALQKASQYAQMFKRNR